MDVAAKPFGRPGTMPGRAQTIVVMAIVILAIGGLTWYVTDGFDDGVTSIAIAGDAAIEPPAVGKVPTGFTGLGYDGQPIALASYAGKPLWLTFGASWCRDCRVEAADLEATYEKHRGEGLNVLAVFINDLPADIAGYVQRARLTFPIAADQTARIAGAYKIVGIPTHIFIGRDGLIREIKIGALSKGEMEAAVDGILR
jgi:cytochrome c biogenesis protein CcmG/thiol:disulfide interchange protein DsbE